MPELPEVETIVRMLAPNVAGKRIEAAELRLGRLLLEPLPGEFSERLKGKAIAGILRRGKYIVMELEDSSLVIHLGMTGQLTFSPARYAEDPEFIRTVTGLQKAAGVHPVDKHTHLILHLEGGERVLFRDPRTFGKLFLVPGREWPKHPRLSLLGDDPLELRVKPFLRRSFAEEPKGRSRHAGRGRPGSSRSVKALLLDQSFIAGVGNIYADEALFRSGIHPASRVKDLGVTDMIRLLEAVKHVLRKGIANSGTSFSDYRKPDGTEGSNYERLQVYGRGGRPCRRCRTALRKSVVAQRGTVHCPRCQKKAR